ETNGILYYSESANITVKENQSVSITINPIKLRFRNYDIDCSKLFIFALFSIVFLCNSFKALIKKIKSKNHLK
ncbi:MAG: hypothetical protein ACTSW1_06440, partial [Candidatus Hodarchaeales archaeon]